MMPGLIDAHAHLFMLGYGNEADWFTWLKTDGKKYSIEKVMELSAYQMLMSGITGAIDLGGNPVESISVRNRINKGEIQGHACRWRGRSSRAPLSTASRLKPPPSSRARRKRRRSSIGFTPWASTSSRRIRA